MSNREKLRDLMVEVFLLTDEEFRFDLTRAEIDTWDSLGIVSLAVGIEETFKYHLTPEEATKLESVQDVMTVLETRGVDFAA